MSILDTIFNAWGAVVPLGALAAIMSGLFLEELIYTFIENWDMV